MGWDLLLMIGLMFGIACYMALGKRLSEVVLGIMVFSNAINLLIMLTTLQPANRSAAMIGDTLSDSGYVDPLPQAMTLTAIVIGFGLISFFMVMLYKIFGENQSEDLNVLF